MYTITQFKGLTREHKNKLLHDHGTYLPYYEATSTSAAAFNIDNYSAISASSAVKGYAGGGGRGVEGISNSGIGVYAKSNTGNALQVDGKVRITGNGQAPNQGKVLTTDNLGNATWEGAVAFSAVGIKYNYHVVPSGGASTKLRFHAVLYDLSSAYTGPEAANHSTFIAPVDGIYHFDLAMAWLYTSSGISGITYLYLMGAEGGVEKILARVNSRPDGQVIAHDRISIDVKLTAGTQVYGKVSQHTGDPLNIDYENADTYFNGRLVVKL